MRSQYFTAWLPPSLRYYITCAEAAVSRVKYLFENILRICIISFIELV